MRRTIKTEKLQDILSGFTREQLDQMTYFYHIPGKSKMKKVELVEALAEKMKSTEVICESQSILGEAYMKIEENEEYDELEKNFSKARALCTLGYGNMVSDDEGIKITVAKDILEVLDKVDEKVDIEVRRYTIVKALILACVRLYGAYEVDTFIEIFNKLLVNEEPINMEELNIHLMRCEKMSEEAVRHNNLIVSESLLMYEGDLDNLLQMQKGKEYYIPDIDELLNYEDEFYVEKTKEYKEFEKFIFKIVKDREMAQGIVEDVASCLRWEVANVKSLVYEFERRDIAFNDVNEVNKLVKLYMNLSNNTRVWANKGFTPNELRKYEELKPVKIEIKRNDQCPCGSGKKYKKCCLK